MSHFSLTKFLFFKNRTTLNDKKFFFIFTQRHTFHSFFPSLPQQTLHIPTYTYTYNLYLYSAVYCISISFFFFFHLTTGNTGIRVKIVLYRDAETERVNNTLSNVVWCRFSGIVLRRTKKLRTRSSGPSTRTFIYVYIIHI